MSKEKVIEITRGEAKKWLSQNTPAMRSCWNCNPAHEGLKNATYVINCFECGHWFFNGSDITIT